MSPEIFIFNLFFIFTLITAFLVVSSKNAVYSVFYLILTFCNIIFILLLLGAEFFAFLLLIVYVGAIAVLFLFVIMMLNVNKSIKTLFFLDQLFLYFPLVILCFIFMWDYFYQIGNLFDFLNDHSKNQIYKINNYDLQLNNWFFELNSLTNIQAIGKVLYSTYGLLFVLCSFILLIAMIGVIVLTINQKIDKGKAKRQRIDIQLNRKSKKVLKFIDLRKY